MAESTIKHLIKSLQGIEITQDMVENVINVKEEINKLDDIVNVGQTRTDNDNIRRRKRHGNNERDKIRGHSHLVGCNICKETFQIISDLEKHIKREHKDSERFQCVYCKKKFVTNWRLEKHLKIHFKRTIKSCKYFANETFCPFEELGCKFRHDENIIEKEDDSSTDKNPHGIMNGDKTEEADNSKKFQTKSDKSSMVISDIVIDMDIGHGGRST